MRLDKRKLRGRAPYSGAIEIPKVGIAMQKDIWESVRYSASERGITVGKLVLQAVAAYVGAIAHHDLTPDDSYATIAKGRRRNVTVPMHDRMRDKLDYIARLCNTSRSALVREAVDHYAWLLADRQIDPGDPLPFDNPSRTRT